VFLLLCATIISGQYTAQKQLQQPYALVQQQQQQIDDDLNSAAANTPYRARPYNSFNSNRDEVEEEEEETVPVYQTRRPQQQNQFRKPSDVKEAPEEELEEEEPDRLSLLLAKSAFNCNGRTTGYYSDEGLGCEIFHYCQENQKHSWICPEGFTFHQIHLICMPPSNDNICEQSSKYTFVNDYLYKPINMEEHQSRPNISLRYSERYYPENFYLDERQNDNYEERRPPQQQQNNQEHRQRQPIQVGLSNVRKAPSPTPTPSSYRTVTPTPAQQNVYRSPEEINISLQQRRPLIYSSPTTPRYEEEEYGYEK
jgi:hypothetical protein